MGSLATHAADMPALSSVRPTTRPDAADVTAAVSKYCRALRLNASDTVAAINYALLAGGDTFSASRAGRRRAAQLHERSTHSHPPTKA